MPSTLMTDLDRLRVFLRVVERGSFTAAAAQLGMPVTSASRRVRALEEELGVRLLHRTTRRVSVTEAGRDFYERCARAEEILEEAEASVRALRDEPEGTLRVLVSYALGLSVLEPALAEFRHRYPRVRLELTFDNHPLDLIKHGFDVALRAGPLADSGYVMRRLGRSRARLVASPAYLDRAGRPSGPQELTRHALLAIGTGAQLTTWRLRDAMGNLAEITIRPILASNESLTILSQAGSGAGITLAGAQLIAGRLAAGELETVLPQWHRAEDAEVVALFPSRATLDRKVRAFIEFATEIFAPWAGEEPSP